VPGLGTFCPGLPGQHSTLNPCGRGTSVSAAYAAVLVGLSEGDGTLRVGHGAVVAQESRKTFVLGAAAGVCCWHSVKA